MTAPSGIRILVVEDDPVFQRILQKRIASEGYEVFIASDGREGLREIVAHEPHLVVSDWMMPQVDGLELCQSVKTGLGDAAPYFILLTAKGEISEKLLGLETGADDFLVKPCDSGELMARIRAGVRIVSLTKELQRKVAQLGAALAERQTKGGASHAAGPGTLCPGCRRVRTADGRWQPLDAFVAEHGGRKGGAPVCPDCAGDEKGRGRKAA